MGHDRRMRIGINGSGLIVLGQPLDQLVAHAAEAEAAGFSSYWLAQMGAPDALTVLALMGQATSRIELGTAVVPTWPRHPLMLAGQALTTAEACGGRLSLGLGLAHKPTVEFTYGFPFARPARHMAEYLDVLIPVMAERTVEVEGEIWSARVESLGGRGDVGPPPVLLAAMGPRMLELAGRRTDGTILWLSGPRTVAGHIVPAIGAAAEAAGRPAPRVIAGTPVCVTDDPDRVRGFLDELFVGYNDMPSYRGVMDAEGVAGPGAVSVVGDEAEVRAHLTRFAEAGATDFMAAEVPSSAEEATRTRALLTEVATAGL